LGNRLIAFAIFLGNLLILGPFLLTGYSSQSWNNGYVYMAISRMFHDHPWTWNRLQYAGAPFHYLYPPVFHVLTVLVPFASIGHAFHIVAAIGYALVPVCLYILAVQLFESKLVAILAAVAYSVFPSPVYYLLPTWKNLAIPYANAPWGYVAMIAYEEAAHAFAFSFTLLAIAAAWRNRWTLASLLAAVVFLTNWPAMIGLGLALSAIAVRRGMLRLVGAVGTAYGLAAFWMSPGYFVSSTLLNRIVIRHTIPSTPWTETTFIILGCAALLAGASLWRRIPAEFALLIAWVAVLGAVVFCFSLVGNNLAPMPNRYMLEFNAGCILLFAGLTRWSKGLGILVLVAGIAASYGFILHAWKFQAPGVDPHTLLTYQISDWLKQHAGSSRVLAAGELDSTLALWSDVPQAGGTGQDVSNFLMFAAQRQVTFSCAADSEPLAKLWLRALNVHYFVVHESQSREYFHWFSQPEKFRTMPVAWDSGAGDRIYEIPDQHEAVVVDLNELHRLPPMRSTADGEFLEAYVKWAAGKRPASIRWTGDDRATVDASLGSDEAILVKDTHDRGWHTESDPIGFMLVRKAGEIRFRASWDVWLSRAVTVLTIILLLLRIPGWKIALLAVVPCVLAYGVLLPISGVEEEAFARLQPPFISPGGIVDAGGGIYSVYGMNFGGKFDIPKVQVGDTQAQVIYHSPGLVVFKTPSGPAPLSIEANGCRGNGFILPVSVSRPGQPAHP